jgi:hypothetical protein
MSDRHDSLGCRRAVVLTTIGWEEARARKYFHVWAKEILLQEKREAFALGDNLKMFHSVTLFTSPLAVAKKVNN